MLAPLSFALAALLSAWVLYNARRRALRLPAVVAWTLTTLLFTPVVFPLYLVSLLFDSTPPRADASCSEIPDEEIDAPVANAVGDDDVAVRGPQTRGRFALPLLYLSLLLVPAALYFYADYRSADAHLARAEAAKLRNRRSVAVREYRAALAIADDAHTRKLLGVELLIEGRAEEALAEFVAAERAGEPDALLPLRIGSLLDSLGRPSAASAAYQRFLSTRACAASHAPDENCERARLRLGQLQMPRVSESR